MALPARVRHRCIVALALGEGQYDHGLDKGRWGRPSCGPFVFWGSLGRPCPETICFGALSGETISVTIYFGAGIRGPFPRPFFRRPKLG